METVQLDTVDSYTRPGKVFSPLSDPLDTSGLAINYYEVASGESIGDCYHRHHEQEEVFYVLSGTATFETETGDVAVGPNELIRFAPGEWQQGTNRGDDHLRVLALGAPREARPTDLRRECPACGERTPATAEWTGEEEVYYCEVCGAETGRYA
jgi:mannose-6-phosphate isomerase-like protein (cupin superfamily)